MIDLSGILMLQYMTSSRIFEKKRYRQIDLFRQAFFWPKTLQGSQSANIENQSATIAFFFSSSRFFFFFFLLSFSFASVISG